MRESRALVRFYILSPFCRLWLSEAGCLAISRAVLLSLSPKVLCAIYTRNSPSPLRLGSPKPFLLAPAPFRSVTRSNMEQED